MFSKFFSWKAVSLLNLIRRSAWDSLLNRFKWPIKLRLRIREKQALQYQLEQQLLIYVSPRGLPVTYRSARIIAIYTGPNGCRTKASRLRLRISAAWPFRSKEICRIEDSLASGLLLLNLLKCHVCTSGQRHATYQGSNHEQYVH
jgi:hypothetical protein